MERLEVTCQMLAKGDLTHGKRKIEPFTCRGGIVNDEIAALKQEIAELKKQTEPYKAGDVIHYEGTPGVSLCGFVTSDAKIMYFTFPVSKPINASTITVSKLTVEARYATGGYINSAGWQDLDFTNCTFLATNNSGIGVTINATNEKKWQPYGSSDLNNYMVSVLVKSLDLTLS